VAFEAVRLFTITDIWSHLKLFACSQLQIGYLVTFEAVRLFTITDIWSHLKLFACSQLQISGHSVQGRELLDKPVN